MKRVFLVCGAASLAALSLSTTANAEPAIIYVPTEAIDLVPTEFCPVPQSGQSNAGLGCGGVADAATIEPYEGDIDALVTGISAALEPYDVMVTTERPPEYVPYFMLMATAEEAPDSMSFTCTSGAPQCGGVKRNSLMFTSGVTMQCTETPDPVAAAMFVIGSNLGLEGSTDPTDWMFYPPDYTMPGTTFVDACVPMQPRNGFDDQDNVIELDLDCTDEEHLECEKADKDIREQNTHADLLDRYGARVEDTDPPELTDIVPEDGAVLMQGELNLDVTITDADPTVAVRWTISSPTLMEIVDENDEPIWPDGTQCKATNRACQNFQSGGVLEWEGETFNKPTDSDWSVTELAMAPPGEYTITLEVSDYHGNVADIVTRTVTVMGAGDDDDDDAVDSSGGDGMMDDGMDDGSVFTTGNDDTGDGGDDGNADGGDDGDSSGCSCTASPQSGGLAILLMGLFGLGLRRRD